MSTESHMVTGDKLPPLYKSLVLSLPLKKKKDSIQLIIIHSQIPINTE